jgi:hypothetical protein
VEERELAAGRLQLAARTEQEQILVKEKIKEKEKVKERIKERAGAPTGMHGKEQLPVGTRVAGIADGADKEDLMGARGVQEQLRHPEEKRKERGPKREEELRKGLSHLALTVGRRIIPQKSASTILRKEPLEDIGSSSSSNPNMDLQHNNNLPRLRTRRTNICRVRYHRPGTTGQALQPEPRPRTRIQTEARVM